LETAGNSSVFVADNACLLAFRPYHRLSYRRANLQNNRGYEQTKQSNVQ
jgi:hypothetical protein